MKITTTRRDLLLGAGAIAAMPDAAWALQGGAAVTPEQFGALGDGRTNDSDAFAAMSAFATARGGGEIVLRRTT